MFGAGRTTMRCMAWCCRAGAIAARICTIAARICTIAARICTAAGTLVILLPARAARQVSTQPQAAPTYPTASVLVLDVLVMCSATNKCVLAVTFPPFCHHLSPCFLLQLPTASCLRYTVAASWPDIPSTPSVTQGPSGFTWQGSGQTCRQVGVN